MKKILSLILAFSVLISAISVAPVSANVATKYNYAFLVHTMNTEHAGTDDSTVVMGVSTYETGTNSDYTANYSSNGHHFDANRTDEYAFSLDNIPPWRMNEFVFWLVGSDAWDVGSVTIWLPTMDGTLNPTQAKTLTLNLATRDKGRIYRDISDVTKRKFTDMGGVDIGGGDFYLNSESTGSISKEWDKKVRDQYAPHNAYVQKDSYDIMKYEDAPVFDYTISDSSVGEAWLKFQRPSATQNFILEVDRKKLYDAMVAQNKGELKLTYTVALLAQSTNPEGLNGTFAHTVSGDVKTYSKKNIGGMEYYYKDVTYTFYRSIYDLSNASISQTETFAHAQDNYYLNRNLRDVTITVEPVSLHKKSMTQEEKTELITNFQATPSLYLGNSKTTKLTDLTMTKLLGNDGKPNGTLQFTGQVPFDVTEIASEGIRLQLDNVSTHLRKRDVNQAYQLENPTSKYEELGADTSASFYFSTHKVDTKSATVRITDEDGIDLVGANSIQNNIKKMHEFYAVSSETLYPDGNVTHTVNNQNYFKYELYKKAGDSYEPAVTRITNFDGTGNKATVTAPIHTQVLKGVNIKLRTIDLMEGTYKLRFYGWDKADNPLGGDTGYSEIENIMLDTLAPRVTVAETVHPQDGQYRKRNDYAFEMSDLQQSTTNGWSRTYYTFMNGTGAPATPVLDQIEPASKEIASTLGEWAFIDSKGESTTAMISIPKGSNFDGKLYYFTVDSLGNDSRNEQSSTYFNRAVQIFNGDVVDTLITEDTTLPKPRFTISFDTSNSNFETSYRWISHPNNDRTFTQNYRVYGENHDVGSNQKTHVNGQTASMDGKYILQYTVTDKRSGNKAEYSREYVYDYFHPEVTFTVGAQHDHFKSSHQFSVEVTDRSGIASAYYYLAGPDSDVKIPNTDNYLLIPEGESVGQLNHTFTITGIPSGAYSVVVVATDPHGRETKKVSPYFGIRSGAPTITELKHAQSKTVNGMGATTDGSYRISTILSEPHISWTSDSMKKYQNPVYYVATEDVATDEVIRVTGFTAGNNSGGYFGFTLNTPVQLTEGVNNVYLSFGLINHPAETAPEFVTERTAVQILYDTQAPTFELPDYSTIQPTNASVTARIVANDVGTGISKLTVSPEDAGKITVSPYANGAFTVTVKENITTNLTLSDELGNSVLVPISVSNIDRTAPSTLASREIVTKGARQDGIVTVDVSDKNDTTVSYALIKDPMANHILTEADYALFHSSKSVEMKSSPVIVNGEGNKQKTYEIDLRGLSGSYAIGIKAVDSAGNVTEKVFFDSKLDLVDAQASIVSVSANPSTTKTTSTVTVTFNVPVTVMPNAPIEGDAVGAMARSNLLYTGLLTTSANYVMNYDVVIQNNNKISLYVQDEVGRDRVLEFTPGVEFVTGFDITGYVEKNGQTIQNGGFISYNEGDKLYYVVVPNPKYSGQYFFVENAVLSGLELNAELSVTAATYGSAYSKLVFEALRDGKTTKSAYFEAYTAEGFEADRMEAEYVAISVVDETAPVANVVYSITEPTNQNVNATLSISDPESGILKLERSYDGINFSPIDSIVSHTETFEQNATVSFKVTNKAGMETIVPVTVSNIDKTPITQDRHYTVEFAYENYLGNWVPIQEGKAYRRVMATLKFIGDEKTLSMTNNNAALSRTLTQENPTFTFEFRDHSGNTGSHTASYNQFDNTIGQTSYVLSNTSKTNQNIFATITLSDDSGEIAFAEVKKGDVVYPFKGEPLENEYIVELDSSGIYHVTAYDNAGNKWTTPITVSNINKVAPIATARTYSTLPTAITTQSVNVELTQFSKDIKTITVTGVELTGSLTANDIVHIPGTKAVRFRKNGTVTMFFVDDYGNEGHEVITISNIVSTPPQISATAALAEDKLSVNVTFDQIRDNDGVPLDMLRKLTDLTVSYRGYEYALLTEVKDENGDVVSYKDAVINVKTNGEHVFQVRDKTGLTQKILLTVEGIEVGGPKVKEVRWTYKYLEQNQTGEWVEKDYQNKIMVGVDTSGKEAGYVVGIDKNPTTNQNVQVTLITDKDAKLVGGRDPWEQEKSMNYRENGLYHFNLQGRTGDYTSYGVNVGVIDKTAPVLQLKNGEELIFIEGMTPAKDASIAYDKSKLLDFEAWDVVAGQKVDLTNRVTISYGAGGRVFNPDNISANEFVRSNPYYIDYTVRDDAGNQTTIRRTIRLVGLYDTIALVNGVMPDSTNVATVLGNKVEISLKNFSGISYARYEKGILTQGQMKTKGTVLREKNGVYTMDNISDGWYTVYIQTDKRDYFNIAVYVSNQGGK
jgi:large repetitive protein